MHLHIFLLLYFFVGIFTFVIANRDEPNCHLSKLLKDASPSKKLVQPRNNGQWSRFVDGKYAIVGLDPIQFWVKLPYTNLNRYGITVKYTTFGVPSDDNLSLNKYMVIQPFGLKDCQQDKNHLEEKGSFPLQYCRCDFYMRNDEAYFLPIKVWTSAASSHKVYFEQFEETLEIYLFEDEAAIWDSLKTCPNAGILSQDRTTRVNGLNLYDLTYVGDNKNDGKTGSFYLENGIHYVNFNSYDVVAMLLIRDWTIKPYVHIELQDGKTLHQSVEIKIEVNGEAPDKNAAILINDGTGLKITFKHSRCLQCHNYNGLVRYVIRVSEPGLLRANFYDQTDQHLDLYIPMETLALFYGPERTARSNNHFTSYWIIYTPPGVQPPPASDNETPPGKSEAAGANNETPPGKSEAACDDGLLFLWLLIIVLCIDVILVIILVLLIIFAHRGSKKMKTVMAKKKMKDPKAAAATPAKQDAAATATSPMTEAKGKNLKPAEKEIKGKPAAGKKSTDGKTTTFYTVDQTKFYTVDNTFDKSKKGKK